MFSWQGLGQHIVQCKPPQGCQTSQRSADILELHETMQGQYFCVRLHMQQQRRYHQSPLCTG